MTNATFETSDFCCITSLLYHNIYPLKITDDLGCRTRKVFTFIRDEKTENILKKLDENSLLVQARDFHQAMRKAKAII
jgi:hypothetical protein